MKINHAALAAVGRALFPYRLLIGLAVVCVAIEWLSPAPLFAEHYRLPHALGVLAILAGLVLRAWGAGSAGRHTRSQTIEAPRLATGGPFAHLRNPIYAGSICLGMGMSLILTDPIAFGFSALAFAILYFAIVPAEEDYLRREFGAEYLNYCAAVPRLIPRVLPWPGRTRTPFHWRAIFGEFGILMILVAIYGAILLEECWDARG